MMPISFQMKFVHFWIALRSWKIIFDCILSAFFLRYAQLLSETIEFLLLKNMKLIGKGNRKDKRFFIETAAYLFPASTHIFTCSGNRTKSYQLNVLANLASD